MKRVGLFGGTFNPPHLAHRRLALEAQRVCALDEVIVMPTFLPPHKNASCLLSGEARLELCRRTFCAPCFTCSDYELQKGGRSYTVETLRYLKAQRPDDRLFLIVGSDMFLSFHQWYCWQEILSLCSLIVLSREQNVTEPVIRDYASSVLHLQESDYCVLHCDPQELSSTQIRTLLLQGADVSAYLSEEAYQLIKEKGYYQ